MSNHTTDIPITQLPLRSANEVFVDCRSAVVFAPHPDDESLGCGGAIALLRQRSIPVHIIVVSDGTGSHPRSRRYPPSRLRALREQETQAAASYLGVTADAITFWRWIDQHVPTVGTDEFLMAVERCDRDLRHHQPDWVFVPWQHDQHCDHRATWHIVQHGLSTWQHPPRQLVYSIWGSKAGGLTTLPSHTTGWRLDIRLVEAAKRAAVMAHKTQTTDLIDDDPDGFRLTDDLLSNLIQPWEPYLTV